MKPWLRIATTTAPDGDPFVLMQRDQEFVIRVNGMELMSSRRHGSEEAMAVVAEDAIGRPRARVLVGGLGMGYTLRAVLDRLGPGGRVIVAELARGILDWNRGVLGPLAGKPLEDRRVLAMCRDVAVLLAEESQPKADRFDAILMDVDNGPWALVTPSNRRLWEDQGIANVAKALRPNGTLVVWSTDPQPFFVARLRAGGFVVDVQSARSNGKRGDRHTLFVARLQSR